MLTFEPPEGYARTCLVQAELGCKNTPCGSEDPNIKVTNLTLACDVIVNNVTLANDTTSFKWMVGCTDTVEEPEQEVSTKGPTVTPRRRYNLASTTDYIRSTQRLTPLPEPSCLVRYIVGAGKTPFGFSYLLNVETSGDVSLTHDSSLSSWNSIRCSVPQETGLISENTLAASAENPSSGGSDSTQDAQCQVEVSCYNKFVFSNGVCGQPVLLMLEVKAAPGIEQADFRLGMEEFVNTSGILVDSEVILWQDPATCIGEGHEGQGNTTNVYYGLYYLLYDNSESRAPNQIPMMENLQTALLQLSISGKNLTDVFEPITLCALLKDETEINIGIQLMADIGVDIFRLRNRY